MAFMRCVGIIAAALVRFVSSVSAATIYSINWLSDPQPCASVLESPLGGPIISKYYASCNFEGMPVSICPGMSGGPNLQQPWHARAEIRIVGYQLSVILPDPTTKANCRSRLVPPEERWSGHLCDALCDGHNNGPAVVSVRLQHSVRKRWRAH